MKIKNQVPLERLIAKIDNDFNISESDWIPRVSAWVIDALGQMKCLPMETKRRKVEVSNKIANYPCPLIAKSVRVFDKNGCEIPALTHENNCCGNIQQNATSDRQIGVTDSSNKTGVNVVEVANIINANGRNFVVAGNNIELNFDTDYIYVETLEVATYYDEYYDTEVPYIYDNAYLLEALAWYVLYKYLSRGSKHQVYSLTSPNQILNPFIQWNSIKNKATTAVMIDLSNDNDGWRNFFYNSTFAPRG